VPDFPIRWSDWSGGDYGDLDSAKAETNQYHGNNVVVYDSGLIGPRAGLKPLTVTGLPNHTTAPGPMGFSSFGNNLLIVLDRLYQIPVTTGVAVANDVYPTAAANPVRFARANGILYTLKDGVVYKHVGTGTAAATMPVGVTFSELVQWEQWLIGVDATVPYRIWFTELTAAGPNFDVWPANNFLYVGGTQTIRALLPIYNTLYVGKTSGWWAISGVLGIQASVRAITIGNGPRDSRRAAATTDNRIIYWPNQDSPAIFNGETVRIQHRQTLRQALTAFPSDGIAITPSHQKVYMAGDADANNDATDLYEFRQGRWSYLSLNSAIGGILPQDPTCACSLPSGVIFTVNNPTTVGNAVVISSFHHALDRPAHTSDQWASPTDPGDTELVAGELELRSWYDGQGRQVRVRGLIVQFRKWTSGVADSLNRMSVNVTVNGQYEAGGATSETAEWYEPCERATDDGIDDSWRIGLGAQGWGNGLTITFPKLQGVAIREVIALCDVRQEKM
jgi:hypothetical protein